MIKNLFASILIVFVGQLAFAQNSLPLAGRSPAAAPTAKQSATPSQQQKNLRCEEVQTDGEWLFHIADANNQHLGKTDFNGYFTSKQECESSLKNFANNQICLYAGGWQSFELTKKLLAGTKYKTAQECFAQIKKSSQERLCEVGVDNKSAYPKNLKNRIYPSESACEQAVSSSMSGKLCVPNRIDGYSILYYQTNKWVEPAFSYPTIEACAKKVAFPIVNFKTDPSKIRETFLAGPNKEIGFTLKQCQDSRHKNHIVKNDKGLLVPECFPDTFYSWGDNKKLQWYSENLNNNTWKTQFKRPLFMTQSPVSTFGYGPIAMRIKLKPNIKAKLVFKSQVTEICSSLGDSDPETTILVAQWTNYSASGVDYVLCSGAPIESWSYGTKTHYDEIVRDLTWMKTHPESEYATYIKDRTDRGVVFDIHLDQNNFSESTLNNSLAYHRSLVENKLGQIFYAPGEERNHKHHFHTRLPIYYNW